MRLYPAYPGNPRRYIEGESPHLWSRTYSLTDTSSMGASIMWDREAELFRGRPPIDRRECQLSPVSTHEFVRFVKGQPRIQDFLSDRQQPLTRGTIYYLVTMAAKQAGLRNVHPHTLRHSCGYHLAAEGTDLRTIQDYLGHRDPGHTAHYTRIAGTRFGGLWK